MGEDNAWLWITETMNNVRGEQVMDPFIKAREFRNGIWTKMVDRRDVFVYLEFSVTCGGYSWERTYILDWPSMTIQVRSFCCHADRFIAKTAFSRRVWNLWPGPSNFEIKIGALVTLRLDLIVWERRLLSREDEDERGRGISYIGKRKTANDESKKINFLLEGSSQICMDLPFVFCLAKLKI